jgi:hypothetical protein
MVVDLEDVDEQLQIDLPERYRSCGELLAHVPTDDSCGAVPQGPASAKAGTVSDPDSAISGTYLTKIVNRHAAEDAWLTGRRRSENCFDYGRRSGGSAALRNSAMRAGLTVGDGGSL